MPLRERAITNKEIFDISMDKFSKIVNEIRKKSLVQNIDTRVEEDMEKKYVLILANGDIVITNQGKDEKVGNALIDRMEKYI